MIRYLKGTLDKGIRIRKTIDLKICVFTYSDWERDKDDRTSTSVYIIYVGKILVSWSSKKQKMVTRLSTEVEFCAITLSVSELC